jgi:lysozyme
VNVSQNGIDLITRFEGCVLHAYDDGYGTWTIGWGHTGHDVHPGLTISRGQAVNLLKGDLQHTASQIAEYVHKPLNQCQFDALASLVFNGGVAPLLGTLGHKLNAGDYAGASAEFPKWNKAKKNGVLVVSQGLVNRRAAERKLFDSEPAQPQVSRWLTTMEHEWVTRYDELEAAGHGNTAEAQQLRTRIRRQCKVIWTLAQPAARGGDGNGWHYRHRAERYRALASCVGGVSMPVAAVGHSAH